MSSGRPSHPRVRALTRLIATAFATLAPATASFAQSEIPVPVDSALTDVLLEPIGAFEQVWFETGHSLDADSLVGKPDLPVHRVFALLPADAELASIQVTSEMSPVTLAGDHVPLPVLPETFDGDIEDIAEAVLDSTVYGSTDPYPSRRYWIERIGYLRGLQVIVLAVSSLDYIGADEDLRVYPESEVVIRWTSGSSPEERGVRRRLRPDRRWSLREHEKSWIAGTVVNPEDLDVYYPDVVLGRGAVDSVPSYRGFRPTELPSVESTPVDMVIITASTDLAGGTIGNVTGQFQRLASWKVQRGVPTVVRSLSWIDEHYPGLDLAERMRNFIIDAYEKWGVDWVLLGGDVNVVPTRFTGALGPGDPPTDFYFSCLDGTWNADGDHIFGESDEEPAASDPFCEVYVGRAPVETQAEAEIFVDKVLAYEKGIRRGRQDRGHCVAGLPAEAGRLTRGGRATTGRPVPPGLFFVGLRQASRRDVVNATVTR